MSRTFFGLPLGLILIHVPTVFSSDRFPFPGMIRFSVGFESYQTLEEHVMKALDTLK